MKYILLLVTIVFFNTNTPAQIPDGYYQDAEGRIRYELKTTLYQIIKNHTSQTYGSLWEYFKITDNKGNSQVWDMYTDIPDNTPAYIFYFGDNQCGSYKVEGDCYNREHSWPKSWFDDAAPMYSDLFHLYPTDGKVNGMRDNYPFAEVGTATYTSSNGSKLGSCKSPGYSGIVFEPIDEYKGDFARSYFYMATRYENIIANWEKNESNGDVIMNGTPDQVFEPWYVNLLLKWHKQDPVSEKETRRNNAVYDIQKNRNPFIDHPEYATLIWGETTGIKHLKSNQQLEIAQSKNKITISTRASTALNQIDICHIQGNIIQIIKINAQETSIEISTDPLPSGIYIIIGYDKEGQKYINKIIL
ncbi:MAG: endonuclease [Breznakibacter sp.]